ncbi:MAG: acetate--CoA ligase family protein [Actinomycetota bacterium]
MAQEPSHTGDRRTPIQRMLEARSIAVVGASIKPGSLGESMLAELRRGGFDGTIYPVNPGYDQVAGLRCYPSILDVPEPVDLAILGVANARVEQALTDAAAAGAGSAVTFSSLYEEPADGPSLRERLCAIAVANDMALCGGNGMGFMNQESRVRATGFLTPEHLRHGPVTFLSHSGSAFSAIAFSDRGIGFNLLVSSGQEVVTTHADYLEYALGLESTRVVALLLETVRDPERFRAQLARATERGVAVLAMKVGRTEGSRAMVTAHSGALAGEHGAYEALFDAYGVHEVRTLDEMADTMELFSSPRRARGGSGIASVHDSGGERAMVVDLAADLDVPFAKIGHATIARIQGVLDPGMDAENPLDAWGTGIDGDAIFLEAFAAFADDAEVSASVFCIDMTHQGEPYNEGYLQIAIDSFEGTDKPFCVLSNLASAVSQDEARMLRDRGIPVLEGTDTGLRALAHLLADATWRTRPNAPSLARVDEAVRARWRERLATGEVLSELDGLALLADYGVPVVAARSATTIEAVFAAAEAVGYPVVLKTATPGITHKSDVGGVRVRLSNGAAVRDAYADVAGRLGPEVSVAAMVPEGVEIALGVIVDPTFGPLVLVAAGGVLVEVLRDRRLALAPIGEDAARRLIDGLAMSSILAGVRGAPPADVGGLARAVSRLSVLADDLGDLLVALDVNPVIVTPLECVAVDALVEPRG